MPRKYVRKDNKYCLLSHYDYSEISFTGNTKENSWDKTIFQDGLIGYGNYSKVIAEWYKEIVEALE